MTDSYYKYTWETWNHKNRWKMMRRSDSDVYQLVDAIEYGQTREDLIFFAKWILEVMESEIDQK